MDNTPSIFITGAARGIGLATGQLFLARGWRVGFYDVDAEAIEQAKATVAEGLHHWGVIDVTDPESIQQALTEFTQHTDGRLNVLLNNAGVAYVGEFETFSLEQYSRMVDVNLKGPIQCTHVALPWLQATPNSRVISVSSASALYGNPELTVYAATKSAVRSLAEGWRISLSRFGIHAATVLPMYVDTRMVTDNLEAYRNLKQKDVKLRVEDLARVIWRAATGPKRTIWLVGADTKLFGFLRRILSDGLTRRLMRKVMNYYD